MYLRKSGPGVCWSLWARKMDPKVCWSLCQRLQHTFRSTFHLARSNVLTHGSVDLGCAGVRGHAALRRKSVDLGYAVVVGQRKVLCLRMEKWTSGMLVCACMLSSMLSHRQMHLRCAKVLGQGRVCLLTQKWTCGMLVCLGMLSSMLTHGMVLIV